MEGPFVPVHDIKALNDLLLRSRSEPVILFKHSTTCPISAAAYRQMSRSSVPVGLLVVQQSRDVSREVVRLTGVTHESPQALILRDGSAVWSASHFEITAESVERERRKHI